MENYRESREISVLIPAHNEEEIISITLESIFSQSLKPSEVILICDNCTDNTVELARKYKCDTKENIKIFITENNHGRKAGALNQVFSTLDLKEYVLIMDADTVLHIDAIKSAMDMILKDKRLGGVCSRAGILEYTGDSFLKKLMWTIQHIEYGQFDSHRIETRNKIKVAHGMATLFRLEALKSVPIYREKKLNLKSNIYLEDNLVEDYEISLCLKNSWRLSSCMDMLAFTEVPLELKELWIQRIRWLRGGVDTLRLHSWSRVTVFEILNHWLFIFLMFLRVIAIIMLINYIRIYGFHGFNSVILMVLFLIYIDSIYRLKYVQNIRAFDYFVKFSFIPEILYGWFQAGALIFSYILSFCNIKQRW